MDWNLIKPEEKSLQLKEREIRLKCFEAAMVSKDYSTNNTASREFADILAQAQTLFAWVKG